MTKRQIRDGKKPVVLPPAKTRPIKWALISVYDKTGIVEFAKALVAMEYGIISSGGTAKALRDAGIEVVEVSEITGLRPMLDHRVATLHPRIHAGLLADMVNDKHLQEMVRKHWDIFHLVCVDFYPLKKAVDEPNATRASVKEKTDIGGPCMVRSGAKGDRIVICRAQDRQRVINEMQQYCVGISDALRKELVWRAEAVVSEYCGVSAQFLSQGEWASMSGERVVKLKYGENAHQPDANLYEFPDAATNPLALSNLSLVEGTVPSLVNMTDVDRLLHYATAVAAVWRHNWSYVPRMAFAVKHGNLCGGAVGKDYLAVLRNMVLGDPVSIHGAVIMTNFTITPEGAQVLLRTGVHDGAKNRMYDGVVAPEFAEGATDMLARKVTEKCRLIVNPALANSLYLDTARRRKQVHGGFLDQPASSFVPDFTSKDWRVYGQCNELALMQNIAFAWAIGSRSNSNTITLVNNYMLLANAVGQTSRVRAARLAVSIAKECGHTVALRQGIGYSDSFFPFLDAVEVLINAGLRVVFSTSGAKADKEVRKLCVDHDVTLVQLPDSMARGFFAHGA